MSTNIRSTIICVDDEKMILNILYDQLGSWFGSNYIIEKALSGEEALEILDECLAEKKDVSCVISDYIMPNMKGDELLEKVNLRNPRIKKIMLTGYSSIEGIVSAINRAGLYRYITKPWDSKDLMLTLVEAIKSYEQEKETLRLSNTFETLYRKFEGIAKEWEQKYDTSINAMVKILEIQNMTDVTRMKNVVKYVLLLAKELNLSDKEMKSLIVSAKLHNIGKVSLNEKESGNKDFLLKQQIVTSEQIISQIAESDQLLDSIKYQFEHYSGTGILGLKGAEIPMHARIVAICVYLDELQNSSETVIPNDKIIEMFGQTEVSSRFDPVVVNALIKILHEHGAKK